MHNLNNRLLRHCDGRRSNVGSNRRRAVAKFFSVQSLEQSFRDKCRFFLWSCPNFRRMKLAAVAKTSVIRAAVSKHLTAFDGRTDRHRQVPRCASLKLNSTTRTRTRTRTRHGPDTDKVRARCLVRAKFHYTDPTGPARTLSATRTDPTEFRRKKSPVGSVSGSCSGI